MPRLRLIHVSEKVGFPSNTWAYFVNTHGINKLVAAYFSLRNQYSTNKKCRQARYVQFVILIRHRPFHKTSNDLHHVHLFQPHDWRVPSGLCLVYFIAWNNNWLSIPVYRSIDVTSMRRNLPTENKKTSLAAATLTICYFIFSLKWYIH